jgi:probable rRNA maturation factor
VKVLQFDDQSDLFIDKRQVKQLVDEVFCLKETSSKELIIHFVSKEEIARIHGEFFSDPSPTDCITFPFRTLELLGEIFICPRVAMDYAPNEPYLETSLYIVHAILHLLGYDDIDPEDQAKMREGESQLMSHLIEKKRVLSNPRRDIKNL